MNYDYVIASTNIKAVTFGTVNILTNIPDLFYLLFFISNLRIYLIILDLKYLILPLFIYDFLNIFGLECFNYYYSCKLELNKL